MTPEYPSRVIYSDGKRELLYVIVNNNRNNKEEEACSHSGLASHTERRYSAWGAGTTERDYFFAVYVKSQSVKAARTE